MRTAPFFAAALLAAVSSAPAAVLTFDLVREFSGGTPPAGSSPWVRISFDDAGGAGSVTLKVESLTLTGSEFLTDLYLNLDPSLNANALTFGTETKAGTFALPSKSKGTNGVNGNAAGTFDLGLSFATGGPSNRFGATDVYTVVLAGLPTLTAASFDFLSVGGGQGPLPVAAHIQGIGADGEGSGKITVPEPATLASIGGVLGIAAARRRRSR